MHLQAKSASEKEPFCLAVYMEMASLRSAIMIFLDASDATASNAIVKIHTQTGWLYREGEGHGGTVHGSNYSKLNECPQVK